MWKSKPVPWGQPSCFHRFSTSQPHCWGCRWRLKRKTCSAWPGHPMFVYHVIPGETILCFTEESVQLWKGVTMDVRESCGPSLYILASTRQTTLFSWRHLLVMASQSVADKRLSGRFSCHFVKSVVSILICRNRGASPRHRRKTVTKNIRCEK